VAAARVQERLCTRAADWAVLGGRSTWALGVMKPHRMAVLAFLLPVSGCIPWHFTMRAGVSGVVADSTSLMPISNATITLRDRPGKPTVQAHTDANGKFRIAARQMWSIYIVPMDIFPFQTDATISAPGYETVLVPVSPDPRGQSVVPLGRIHLQARKLQ
jgi:hypothetical protein